MILKIRKWGEGEGRGGGGLLTSFPLYIPNPDLGFGRSRERNKGT